jgi:hypothetical protein
LLTCRRASRAVPRLPSATSHKQRTSGLLATGGVQCLNLQYSLSRTKDQVLYGEEYTKA